MKLLLVGTMIGVLVLAPASADSARQTVGQDVFDLQGARVGKVVRYIDVHGTPGVVIAGSRGTFVTQAENLGTRANGGLLLSLSDRDVNEQRPYDPDHLPVW